MILSTQCVVSDVKAELIIQYILKGLEKLEKYYKRIINMINETLE